MPCSSSLFIGIKLQVMFSNIKELIVSFFKKKMMITCKLLLTCIKFLNIAREDGEKYVIWQDLKKKMLCAQISDDFLNRNYCEHFDHVSYIKRFDWTTRLIKAFLTACVSQNRKIVYC